MNTAELISLTEKEVKQFGGWKLAVASDYTEESDFPAFTEVVNGLFCKDNEITLTTGGDGPAVQTEEFLEVLKMIQERYGEAILKIKYPSDVQEIKSTSPGMGSIREVRFFINEIQLVI